MSEKVIECHIDGKVHRCKIRGLTVKPLLHSRYVSPKSNFIISQSIDLFTMIYSWQGKGLAQLKLEYHINIFGLQHWLKYFRAHPDY